MERCPNCRARGPDTATCRRCGMDLASLIAVEQAAEHLTALGVVRLAAGDPVTASGDLTRALGLYPTPLTKLLLGFAQEMADTAEREPREAADFGYGTV